MNQEYQCSWRRQVLLDETIRDLGVGDAIQRVIGDGKWVVVGGISSRNDRPR